MFAPVLNFSQFRSGRGKWGCAGIPYPAQAESLHARGDWGTRSQDLQVASAGDTETIQKLVLETRFFSHGFSHHHR